MFVIGERINGMFTDIGDAIVARDPKPVQDMARRQLAAGASALDINVGTRVAAAERSDVMAWLVEAVREVSDAPLSIDTPNLEIMRRGVEAASQKGKAVINSATGQEDRLTAFMALAKEFSAGIICLAIDENGVASTADGKAEIGMRALAAAMEADVPIDDVYLDPVLLPVNCDQKAPEVSLQAISMFKMLSDPAPHVVVGLSNVGQGSKERSLINRTMLAMAMGFGLDASIHDPLDEDLMNVVFTADVLMDRSIYSDSYLTASRAGR